MVLDTGTITLAWPIPGVQVRSKMNTTCVASINAKTLAGVRWIYDDML